MLRRLGLAASILVILVAVVIAAAVWMALHALDAAGRLDSVRNDIARVRIDLIQGTDPSADLQAAQHDAAAAKTDTHDPVWFATSWMPPVRTMRGLTAAVDALAADALPTVVHVGTSVEPAKLRVARNRIALAPLRAAASPLAATAGTLLHARDEVAALPSGWGVLGAVRSKVLGELTSLHGSIDDAARFARVGPSMLGENGKRRYFVGIENNAEARATGGLVAAWAIVTADHGTIRVVRRGNDGQLRDAPGPTTSLGPEYDAVYGNYLPTQRWITSNLSPNFPDAADIWAHLWQAQTGQRIDGVFGVDPWGLAGMLGAAGPVTVRGYQGVYTGANLAQYIEQQEYVDFPGLNSTLRKNFVSKVAGAVLHKLLSGSGAPAAITAALGRAAGEGHLALWSAQPAEQAAISGTPLAGELPATRAPFASLHVNSATGSKLDYYVQRSFSYTAGSCQGRYRDSTITVRLTNGAPRHGLPVYVRLRGDLYDDRLVVERVPQNRLFVTVHATDGAALRAATLDGRTTAVSAGVERGHAVFTSEITLDPGVPRTLQLRLSEPVTPGPATTQVQPLARPQHTRLQVPTCG